mgnify:FL=1
MANALWFFIAVWGLGGFIYVMAIVPLQIGEEFEKDKKEADMNGTFMPPHSRLMHRIYPRVSAGVAIELLALGAFYLVTHT